MKGALARIRKHALTIADYAVTHPTDEVRAAFAAIDDETWRALVATVRYPDDGRFLSVLEERI